MSGLELNKIAASILLSSLIAMMAGTIVNILYKPNLSPKERGYSIATNSHTEVAAAEPEAPIDIPALMKAANADNGEKLVKKCVACHSMDKNGPNKVGPHLWNVIGRDKGSVAGYKYSAAMMAKGGKWDYDSLFYMIHKPSAFLPGTKMSFAGLSNPQDVADMIQYLRIKVSDVPAALP